MPAFDVAGARKAGYDDKEILSYVAGEENPDLLPGSDTEKIRLLLARNGKHMLDVEYLSPTQLEPMQEVQFQDWAKKNKVRLEPGWNEDYDMRGLWKANPGAVPDPRGHWPDTYKLPNHPTFSDQSVYATDNAPRWYGKRLIDSQGKVIADETDTSLDLPELPAPRLPQGMRGPPASVPGSEPLNLLGPISAPSPLKGVTPQGQPRRQMTPEEIAVLGAEPGISPTLPPLNAADLAMLALSGPAESTGLPPTLLQMVRYKRPGVSALAQEAAAAYHGTPRVDPIGAKASVFHATDPEYLENILKAGEIVPNPQVLSELGAQRWRDVERLKPLEYNKPVPNELMAKLIERARQDPMAAEFLKEETNRRHFGGPRSFDKQRAQEAIDDWLANPRSRSSPGAVADSDFALFVDNVFGSERTPQILADLGYRMGTPVKNPGVSVSRVPRVASKGSKAVSFVIDPEKAPPMRPFAEASYRKTVLPDKPTWPGTMNQLFEFEDRTYNKAIPLSAAREMWVDKSAIGADPLSWDIAAERPQDIAQRLRNLAQQYGIPLREFETGRDMHAGRATLSSMTKKKRK